MNIKIKLLDYGVSRARVLTARAMVSFKYRHARNEKSSSIGNKIPTTVLRADHILGRECDSDAVIVGSVISDFIVLSTHMAYLLKTKTVFARSVYIVVFI